MTVPVLVLIFARYTQACSDYFSKTTGVISPNLYMNDKNQVKLCISSAFYGSLIFLLYDMALYYFYFSKFVLNTPLIPLIQFKWIFTKFIGRSSTSAYYTSFPLEWFVAELSYCLWKKDFVLSATQKFHQNVRWKINAILYPLKFHEFVWITHVISQFQLIFTGMTNSSNYCAYSTGFVVERFFAMYGYHEA